ncbi:CpsE [Desulforapulum autotrophicum HRM2]|uniref:CpsE n=1 Tax=Desulforapulum autotrophicum (strain ATCC 43914 / DSM 3382 / VKM B-1955 / HRM2) TaxID=177437 RepID=C0QCJ3_DESAH|nr:TIGR03013 family XrtA/PEP-CTERM system glycosyltransferase [Desulforapulum autotrophicum]ACN15070.1 CpsE [Desulforapulum autotrophicum HRM2]
MLRLFKQYYPLRNILFFMVEGLVIFGSVLIATVLLTRSNSYLFDLMLVVRVALVTLVCQISLYYNDLYDFQVASSVSEISIRLLQSLGITAIVLAVIYYFFPLVIIGQGAFILSILFLLVLIIGWRIFYIYVLNQGFYNEKVLILGASDLAVDIFNEVQDKIDCGYTVAAIVPFDGEDCLSGKVPDSLIVKSDRDHLCRTIFDLGINKVIAALKDSRGTFPARELLTCKTAGIEVLEGNSFYELLTGKLLVTKINPSWLIFSDGFKRSTFRMALKRMGDIIFSVVLLVLLFFPLLVVALLIKIDSRGPILFCQDRVGQGRKQYMMYKFRSMVEDAEKKSGPVWALDNDSRITRVGRVIRKFRIDEIPQVWNVFKGNMSFVGPRPERKHFTDELEEKIPYYGERFVVKPGITGWAQVSYAYGASVDDAIEKLNYDLFYIKNMSIMFDVMIVLRTIKTVVFGRGSR